MEQNHMPSEPEKPPSYAQSHDPQTLHLPSVPNTEVPDFRHERRLPPLPPLPLDKQYRQADVLEPRIAPSWPSSNPLTAYYQPSPAHASPMSKSSAIADSPSGMDIDVATPDSRGRRGGSVLSIDDPDVRLAAEALGDLRADFVTSPPHQHNPLPTSTPTSFSSQTAPEPLLSLLTTAHPLLGNTINTSLSAYSASKNYSPRFKSSAEYVERRITPVVNTVSTVNRVTGVEGGVRWFLGGRRPSHHQPIDTESANQGASKRRKVNDNDMDIDTDRNVSRDPYLVHRDLQHRERRPSQGSMAESLPAYDENSSPSYEAHQALVPRGPVSPGSTWQSRLMLSTSGLSVAMSEESLRSLKYCLGWLRWANMHIGNVINALQAVLADSNGTTPETLANVDEADKGALVIRTDAERAAINAKVAELKSDVLKTLKDVVDVVSKYAGGALPENARVLVRRHLTSLPQRFRLASGNTQPRDDGSEEAEVREGAHKVMVLAKEGLDMMSQVSGVLDGTIVSAEEWCERLGRKKREEKDEMNERIGGPPDEERGEMARPTPVGEDVKVG